jgi:erythromycin esterase-like protein
MAPLARPCKEEALRGLVELQESRFVRQARNKDANSEDEYFNALQNARVVKNADLYYRRMYSAEVSTWNVREQHMAESLEELFAYLNRRTRAKVILWGHNAHLGDARATEQRGEHKLNVGQLVRRRHGRDAVLVGFITHHGSVAAASDWDAPPEYKELRPALADSYEALFHEAELPCFMLAFRGQDKELIKSLADSRLQRSIGVIYYSETPERERANHYLTTVLGKQFDTVLHFDHTRAVEPLTEVAVKEHFDVPESYPFGV